jgi:membrane protein involved in colicin uptake
MQRAQAMDTKTILRTLKGLGVAMAGAVERSELVSLLRDTWVQQERQRLFQQQQQQQQQQQRDRDAERRKAADKARRDAEARKHAEATAALAAHMRSAEAKEKARAAAEAEKAKSEASANAIIAEVEKWAHGKALWVLLNEVNGDRSASAHDNLAAIGKAYKRAMLKIHPDKHMGDGNDHVRATEMFKHVTARYEELKKKQK